jgi:hypothetical protein
MLVTAALLLPACSSGIPGTKSPKPIVDSVTKLSINKKRIVNKIFCFKIVF